MDDRAGCGGPPGFARFPFIGDQHVSPTPYYQNTPMLGRLLAEWGEAPAGCLFLLPLWHPVLVAEQMGGPAAIARGPFTCNGRGLGPGPAPPRRAPTRTGLQCSRERSTRFRPAGGRGRSFAVGASGLSERTGRRVPPNPSRSGLVPVQPPAIDRAARLAEGWIASPGLTPDEARKQADTYRERCAAYGRRPGAIVLRRDIYVGASSSEAQTVLQHASAEDIAACRQKL